MLHYILVRYNDRAADREDLRQEIAALFDRALELPGVEEVRLHSAVIESPARYDLMIVMRMQKDALAAFDASSIHREWKERFARYVDAKAIFDCE